MKRVKKLKKSLKSRKKNIKSTRVLAKKFWNWLWHSNSLLSWFTALIFAFVVIKFIFFPLLSLLTGTSLPLVVVESSSMEHPNSFTGEIINGFTGGMLTTSGDFEKWWSRKGEWYEQNGIGKEEAGGWPLKSGFDKGDIIFVYGWFKPKIGDVVIFNANTPHPIIHRIISIDSKGNIQTKGDNNDGQLISEKNISKTALVGKAVLRIPKLGWLKLIFVQTSEKFN